MQHLGHTRSSRRTDHLLLTPDTFVRAALPGMSKATAIVHVSPSAGAGFTQYTAELEEGGRLGEAVGQRFLYILEGVLEVADRQLSRDQFAYVMTGEDVVVRSRQHTRAVVIEKHYEKLPGIESPRMFSGDERAIQPSPLLGDPSIQVRQLIPADVNFDFAVNTMTYEPGAALPMVEAHVMEHGLLMLDGGGIYRLSDSWYPVTAGDFIWMAPYCPQWFGALGKTPARYLIYKDWNRHPLTQP